MAVSTHESRELSIEPGHNDHDSTDIVFGTGDKHARNQAPKLMWSLFPVIDNLIEVMWIDGIILPRLRYELYSNWTNVCDGNIHQAVYQGFMTGEWSLFLPNSRWQMLVSHDFLLMGNCCLWEGLNCGTCRFPHPPGNILYSSAAFSTLYSIWATQRFGLSSLVWDSDGLGVIMSGR